MRYMNWTYMGFGLVALLVLKACIESVIHTYWSARSNYDRDIGNQRYEIAQRICASGHPSPESIWRSVL